MVFKFVRDPGTSFGQHSDEIFCTTKRHMPLDINERRKAYSVLCFSDSSCYCLQWTKLLFWWTQDRQNRQWRRWKKDPNWPGLCPPDCPGRGKRADTDQSLEREHLLYLLYLFNIGLGDMAENGSQYNISCLCLSFSSCHSPFSQKACPENTLTVSSSVPMVSLDGRSHPSVSSP